MANAEITVVGTAELPLITDLHNQIFRPTRTVESIRRRLLGRYNPMLLVANIEGRAVGFATGFELKPTVFFAWLTGVLPDYRRSGVASQLTEAMFGWARERGYESVRMECFNRHRPILHMAIKLGFNIVGIRWDPGASDNLIIFEAPLHEQEHDAS
jgi:GNAT superfamily N-acetyltransferase